MQTRREVLRGFAAAGARLLPASADERARRVAAAEELKPQLQTGDPLLSPYKSHFVNSYCHAWSCMPSYFLRGRGLCQT